MDIVIVDFVITFRFLAIYFAFENNFRTGTGESEIAINRVVGNLSRIEKSEELLTGIDELVEKAVSEAEEIIVRKYSEE